MIPISTMRFNQMVTTSRTVIAMRSLAAENTESSGYESVRVRVDDVMDERMGECADALEQMDIDEDGGAPMDLED